MTMTSRERVHRALDFGCPDRPPRQMWVLPWAEAHHADAVVELLRQWPDDIAGAPDVNVRSPREQGDRFALGTYIDEWGCVFQNVEPGIIGEVKEPLLADVADWRDLRPPYETLPPDVVDARDRVNRACDTSDQFFLAGCCPRPWERMQFIRSTVEAMMDVMDPDAGTRDLLRVIHEFFLKQMEFWVTTTVDAIMFMDDWGSQRQLLVSPAVWRELFKPLYKDYCDLAKAHGKRVFMHSDGNITAIYPDLIEIGVDAINSQLFCMDMSELARIAKGKITFWGEIDRQHVLPAKDPQMGRDAVREVAKHFYDPTGGIIAQFELGPAGNPETARAIFEEWDRVAAGA